MKCFGKIKKETQYIHVRWVFFAFIFAVKTVVMTGKAPVDTDCPLVNKAHVYYEGKDVYDCMLNQVIFLYLTSDSLPMLR